MTVESLVEGSVFPFYAFRGSHREVGEQHGEALRDLIQGHLATIYERAATKSGLTPQRSQDLANGFIPFVQEYAPGFWEEIRGLARGAAISESEAILLQVRQEVANLARFTQSEQECTTFAVSAPFTASGETLAGQNADLPGPMEEISSVIRFEVEDKPRVLMIIPAGQISYIGMNSEGLSGCANFLYCDGWRLGFPRYLLTRLALEQTTLDGALAAALTPPRASSRNLMLTSSSGAMVDVETTAQDHATMWSSGKQVHSNHFLATEMKQFENGKPHSIANSCMRYDRMTEIINQHKGSITAETMETAFRDHANTPDSICEHSATSTTHTFASMIAELDRGRMRVAYGPPCQHQYISHTV